MTMGTGANALVGVDVGGTGVKAALVDLTDGKATGRVRVETPQPATPDAIASAVAGLVHPFPAGGALGCTLPAVVTSGVVRTASHIDPSWIGVHAANVLAARDRPSLRRLERRRRGRRRRSPLRRGAARARSRRDGDDRDRRGHRGLERRQADPELGARVTSS